jgi:hypothetical protein
MAAHCVKVLASSVALIADPPFIMFRVAANMLRSDARAHDLDTHLWSSAKVSPTRLPDSRAGGPDLPAVPASVDYRFDRFLGIP